MVTCLTILPPKGKYRTTFYNSFSFLDLNNILREMVQIQKQQLELEKQRFEMEKQRLDFERVVGSQLMTLVPMVGGLLQRLVYPNVSQPNLTPSESDRKSVV